MIKSTIEKLANPIGFEIGMSDDVIQSELINGFCRGLNTMNYDKRDTQICYIVDKLDNISNEIIIQISEFIKLKNRENGK